MAEYVLPQFHLNGIQLTSIRWLWRVTQAKSLLRKLKCLLMGFARKGSNPFPGKIIFGIFLEFFRWILGEVANRGVESEVCVLDWSRFFASIWKKELLLDVSKGFSDRRIRAFLLTRVEFSPGADSQREFMRYVWSCNSADR